MKNFNRKFTTLLSITFTLFISQSFAQLSIHVNTSSNAVYFNNTAAYNLPVYDMNLVSSTPWGLTTSSGIVFDYTFGCSTQTLGDGSSAFMCYTKSCIWDQYANGLTDLNGISIFSNSSGGGLHHNYQSIDYSWNDQNNGLPLEVNVISSGGGSKNVSPGNVHIAYMAPQTIDYIYVEVDMGSGMVSIPVYINGQLLEQDCAGTWGGSLVNDACGVCDGDNSSCSGCTSSWANNYDQDAILNDGSCVLSGCTDQTALNYNQNATDSDGSCIDAILGCMDSEAVNYDANANTDNGLCRPYTLADVEEAEEAAYAAGAASVTPEDGISQADVDAGFAAGAASITPEDGITQADVTNATPLSLNIPLSLPEGWSLFGYSCIDPIDVIDGFSDVVSDIEIVKDEMGLSYLPLWTYNAIGDLKYGEGYQIKLTESVDDLYFCSTLVTKVVGCTDPTAFNYNSLANTDDQSCEEVVYGCTTSNAFNYNMDANTDDESCIQVINGCTDETAFNYNANANSDDESCQPIVNGCTQLNYVEYNSNANTDNGSCFTVVTNDCIVGQNGAACVELAIENGVDFNSIEDFEVYICLANGDCQSAFENYIGELAVVLGLPYTCEDANACNYMENTSCSYPEMNCYDCNNILINSEDLEGSDACNSLVLEQGGILVNSTDTISWNFTDPNSGATIAETANDIPEFVVAVYDLENELDNNAFTWFEAMAAIESLVIDGYDDWVLPTPAQLAVMSSKVGPENGNIANLISNNSYWSTDYSEERAHYSVFYESQAFYSATSPKNGYSLVRVVRNLD